MDRELLKHIEAKRERQRRFGNVRPIISTTHQGHRFVAVGSRLYFDKGWHTFIDFLIFYIRDVMGKEWWMLELAKPAAERHPIVKWFNHVAEMPESQRPDPKTNLCSAAPDGLMSAFLLLAYDLYVLRDHAKLQDVVVSRLRHRDQFLGARYELFVAATFIRAGCDIAYEDESDTKRKHPEFVATYKPTGLVMSVEAKARQRLIRGEFDVASIEPGVRDLLEDAADKGAKFPLVVFVELNLPPEDAFKKPTWTPHVEKVVTEIAAKRKGSPFALVIFTNRPHLYGEAGEPDPSHHYYALRPSDSPVPESVADALGEAATQYGNIPSDFPDEFKVSTTEG